MIDFSTLRKYIYFPKPYDRRKEPYVVQVLDKWGPSWRGNADVEALLQAQYQYFLMIRCQPYSDELWQEIQDLCARRNEIDVQLENIMMRGMS